MEGYDYQRPFVSQKSLHLFNAIDRDIAYKYGKQVKAINLSNSEYNTRYKGLKKKNNMKRPPSCGRIFSGYLVIRNLDLPGQYETWMPDHVFKELYVLS